jgi:hypothetical protein
VRQVRRWPGAAVVAVAIGGVAIGNSNSATAPVRDQRPSGPRRVVISGDFKVTGAG